MFTPAISLDIFALLNILGIAQGIFLTFLLLDKKENNFANRILVAILISVLLFMTDCLLIYTRYSLDFPSLVFLSLPLSFAMGPMIYLYVLSITRPAFSFKKIYLLNFIPMLMYIAFISIPYILLPTEGKLEILRNMYADPAVRLGDRTFMIILNSVTFTHIVIYLILSYRLLGKGQTREDVTSPKLLESIRVKYYRWLKKILVALFMCWVIWALIAFSLDNVLVEFSVMPAIFSILIYVMGYFGLVQPELFTGKEKRQAAKYESSKLSAEKRQVFLRRLRRAVTEEKCYADESLTLQHLSKLLDIPANYLSQIINEEFNQNFPDFINGYRIRDAQELLQDPRTNHLSILGIAYEVGFNSKSTFYTAFKKHTGMTPSEFLKSQTPRQT